VIIVVVIVKVVVKVVVIVVVVVVEEYDLGVHYYQFNDLVLPIPSHDDPRRG